MIALLLPLSGLEFVEMGISSKLYEHQAAGKPIVCCSRGQPAKYVSKTGSGIIVDPSDHESLSKTIIFFFNNRDEVEKLGKTSRQFVEDNLSCEKVGLKMERIFKSILVQN